jgi:hypothetical protein
MGPNCFSIFEYKAIIFINSVLNEMIDLNPNATYIAYVDEEIKEKVVIPKEKSIDPQTATENKENNPNPYKLP